MKQIKVRNIGNSVDIILTKELGLVNGDIIQTEKNKVCPSFSRIIPYFLYPYFKNLLLAVTLNACANSLSSSSVISCKILPPCA